MSTTSTPCIHPPGIRSHNKRYDYKQHPIRAQCMATVGRGSINRRPARGALQAGALIHGRQARHVTDVTNWGCSGAERRPDPRCRLGPPYRRWGTGAGRPRALPSAAAQRRLQGARCTVVVATSATPQPVGRGPAGRSLPLHATRRRGARAAWFDLIWFHLARPSMTADTSRECLGQSSASGGSRYIG